MNDFDVVIVGAGIAGASIAAELSPHWRVALLEAEAQPGYHSTGRSAAFWDESYGGPQVQPLTTASGPFLERPPADFSEHSLLRPRGVLHIGKGSQASLAEQFEREFAGSGVAMERWHYERMAGKVPGLVPEWSVGVWGQECYDIDVAALHSGYLRAAKRAGAQIICNAEMKAASFADDQWAVNSREGSFTANLLINAAGAWADEAARRSGMEPLGIQPYRRTIIQLEIDPPAPADLPLVIALDGSFYFKPDTGGRLWLSPHDETPTQPCDAVPEEIDIALAIDRMQQVVDWQVKRVEHSWAGLRSFAPDRLPVIGRDPANQAFFWMAGQGGFGIQTAPAAAQLAASLLLQGDPPQGINPEIYSPERFR